MSSPTHAGRLKRHAANWWPAYIVILTAAALRLSILFATPLVPQTDGGYYLAQVRSLLGGEGLRFSDTPLLFWFQAGVARLIMWVASLDERSAIIIGVKLVDAMVPVLAAIPVFALWLRWTVAERRTWFAGLAVAALPALSFGLVKMTGDLQKNAFALVVFATAIWSFDTAARMRSIDACALAVSTLAVLALSHVGVFAAAAVFFVSALLHMQFSDASNARVLRRRLVPVAFVAICGVGGFYAAAQAVPKLAALASSLASPLELFSGENVFTRFAAGFSPAAGADAVAVILAYALVIATAVVWRRLGLEPVTASTVFGAVVATAVLAFPLLGGIDGLRLHLMAYLPASVLFAWVIGRIGATRAMGVAIGLLALNLLMVVPLLPQASQPTIAEPSYPELLSLAERVGDSERTVVVARHGLEWWAAWAFAADIVPTVGATPDLWQRYDDVLLLQEVKVPAPASGPRRGRGTAEYIAGGAVVDGTESIHEGEWYRLSRASSVIPLGEEFEGVQPSGTAPRPRP